MRETKGDTDNMADFLREFGFSEAHIQQVNRLLLALVLFLVFSGGAFAWYICDFRIRMALTIIGRALIVLAPIVAIEVIVLNRRQRKWKVFVHEDRIVKQCGKKQHALLWEDIAGTKRVCNRSGITAQITLYSKKPKTSMYLGGFRDMDDLAKLIRERTPGEVVLQEKRWRLDWQNPLVVVLVAGVPMMAAMFIIASMGSRAMDIFAIVAALSSGLLLLAWRPFTKCDLGFKWIELLAGILMLALGIGGLIFFLVLGRLP